MPIALALLPSFAGATLGACIGSFVAALTMRWPQHRSIIRGRSHCESCARSLNAFELVPIISFLMLGGQCRTCAAPIGNRQIAIEFVAAAIGAVSLALNPDLTGISGAVFGWITLCLLILDVEHFWLPDRITLPLAAFGLAAAWATGQDIMTHAIGTLAGYGSLQLVGLLYRAFTGRDGLGGGDPKLFGAIGAWLGWSLLPYVLMLAGIVGLGLLLIASWRGAKLTRQTMVPFGALLAVAAWPIWLFASA